jgi:type VI secretion system protein
MPLILKLDSTDPKLQQAARRIEVADHLTIGRGSDNDLVLSDPERHLSKNHCAIAFDGRTYTVTDMSTNGVFLNNGPERLPRGTPVPLAEGNLLRLGDYTITITAIAPSGPAHAAPYAAPLGHAPHAAPASDDALFGDPLADPDPFAGPDPFAARPTPSLQTPSHPMPSYPMSGHPMSGHATPHDSGDDELFGAPSGSKPAASGPLIPDDDDLFGDHRPAEPWQGASQADHAPSDQAFFAPPKATIETIPDDWDLSDLGVSPAKPARTPPHPVDEGFAEPLLGTPHPTPATPAPRINSPPAGPASAGDAGAIASFLAAAGLAGTTLSDAEKAALMRLAGEALLSTVQGLTDILAARSTTKQEFRIERTTLGARNNNPLKFSASIEEAMRVMLLGRVPGFLTATQAIEEALGDVKSHQLAVLAGMQVALTTVIARFDPAKLEQRLEQKSLIDGILPSARKARYWELFKGLYKEIATELEDDFQSLFGAEFARAYKEQIDKL